MKKILLDDKLKIEEDCAVVIGKFDGIHKGHIKLLNELQSFKAKGYKTVVFTFEKSILSYFTGKEIKLLQTDEEKEEFLSDFGIDILAVYPVNRESVSIEPEYFIKNILIDKLNARVVIAGPDLSFGDKGRGDFELLQKMSDYYQAVKIEKEIYQPSNKEISSTYVRAVLEEGDIRLCNELLGRPYSISGKVMHGRKLGRVMSFPTVNLLPIDEKLLPVFGVYCAKVLVGSVRYLGVANVGKKPTISDNERVCVETHILDFDDDLYGENIRVELLEFLRPEKKFESVEALKTQLKLDVDRAREYFKGI